MLVHSRRQRLVEAARAMNRQGLNRGRSGNLSVRWNHGFLITPSGMEYERCRSRDLVEMDAQGRVVAGSRPPSTEWRLHGDIYRARPEVAAVLHAHPPACTALACLGRAIPPFHYMVALAGGREIPLADYAVFGSRQLSENVLAALGRDLCACLMAHHGLVCLGSDPDATLELALEVEGLASVYLQTLQAGGGPLLSAAEMALVRERFQDYQRS